jgi:hypothetical protein
MPVYRFPPGLVLFLVLKTVLCFAVNYSLAFFFFFFFVVAVMWWLMFMLDCCRLDIMSPWG